MAVEPSNSSRSVPPPVSPTVEALNRLWADWARRCTRGSSDHSRSTASTATTYRRDVNEASRDDVRPDRAPIWIVSLAVRP